MNIFSEESVFNKEKCLLDNKTMNFKNIFAKF